MVEKRPAPQLIKASTSYKMIVPKQVEEKIRYLLRKFPSTEWSGVLFYDHEGTFEDNNLVITCRDIYPMDLGNATYTDFNMNEDVAAYIANNIELFNCDLGLCHSHHSMQAWFSETDIGTLRSEGNERNCFVSLIVNNEGTYSAAITRKIQSTSEVITKSLGTSYEFFGEGTIKTDETEMTESTKIIDNTVIEYFMLDVERQEAENPLGYLDDRFKEIIKKKEDEKSLTASWKSWGQYKTYTKSASPYKGLSYWDTTKDNKKDTKEYSNAGFYDWLHNKKEKDSKIIEQEVIEEPTLWGKEEMKEMEVSKYEYTPNPKLIQKAVTQMITCCLTIKADSVNLETWIDKHMENIYDDLFKDEDDLSSIAKFDSWNEFIVEFLVTNFKDPEMPDYVVDPIPVVAEAMLDQLAPYRAKNHYIEDYCLNLEAYID